MSAHTIYGDLCVSKAEKEHFRTGKDGRRYMDFKLVPTNKTKHNHDFMVVQNVSKEARDKGIRGPILGNADIYFSKDEPTPFEEDAAEHSGEEGMP